jgi:TonB family protein
LSTTYAPLVPLPDPPRRRLPLWLALSLLGHGALVLVLLLEWERKPMLTPPAEQGVEVVFDGGATLPQQSAGESQPPPGPLMDVPPSPEAEALPQPAAPPPPPVAPPVTTPPIAPPLALAPPPPPAPPLPPVPPQSSLPPQPGPPPPGLAPSAPLPAPLAVPAPPPLAPTPLAPPTGAPPVASLPPPPALPAPLAPPAPPSPPAPAPPDQTAALPMPPAFAPPPEVPPERLRPTPRLRLDVPSLSMLPGFARPAPGGGGQQAAPRSLRGLNLSPGTSVDGRAPRMESAMSFEGSRPGANWQSAVSAWVYQRAYYPMEAARQGEDGPVTVRLVIGRDGKVQSVALVNRSGSRTLDLAWQSIFRDQYLPPLPAELRDAPLTMNFTMNYVLIRR